METDCIQHVSSGTLMASMGQGVLPPSSATKNTNDMPIVASRRCLRVTLNPAIFEDIFKYCIPLFQRFLMVFSATVVKFFRMKVTQVTLSVRQDRLGPDSVFLCPDQCRCWA